LLWIRSIASLNFYHGTILSSGKIYVTNSDNDSVSVINTTDDKKTPHDISIGHNPVNIASNRVTGMVYVVNGGSNSVCDRWGHSDKVAAGVIFNVRLVTNEFQAFAAPLLNSVTPAPQILLRVYPITSSSLILPLRLACRSWLTV